MLWRVIVPVKPQPQAKSRLRDATGDGVRHLELVRAIQLDTIAAVLAADAGVAGVHVVGDPAVFGADVPPRVHLSDDPGLGLNGALRATADELARLFPADGVIAMVADLPALRPAELAAVVLRAGQVARGFVADRTGSGTTMLSASAGQALAPAFGLGSAAAHRKAGAVELDAAAGARSDVDTAEDLRRCLQLGVGEHTARMVAHLV